MRDQIAIGTRASGALALKECPYRTGKGRVCAAGRQCESMRRSRASKELLLSARSGYW